MINGKLTPEPVDYALDLLKDPYVWPGGYLRVLLLEDGEVLCPDCTRSELAEVTGSIPGDGWMPQGVASLEGAELDRNFGMGPTCAHCGRDLLEL